MPTSTVEDYIKRLYVEQNRRTGRLVPMGCLAEAMDVVPGTVTTMIKALADSGLVDYKPRAGVRLTPGGERLALHVLRRHRLLELFLVKALGLDWSEVHAEAEELEHAVSEKVLDRMDALLGRPAVDPHGAPIPNARGKVHPEIRHSLLHVPTGGRCRIARISDADPLFLQFAERNGLLPGARIRVLSRDDSADALVVACGRRAPCTLGSSAASRIFVKPGRLTGATS